MVLPAAISQLRSWDVATAQNVDRFLAISQHGRGADSEVLPPRCDGDLSARQLRRVRQLPPSRVDDYYLIVSRLIPYKRIDLAVDAFTQTGHSAQDRRQRRARPGRRCESRAGRNVEFVGRVSDAELKQLYAGCRGLVFPGEEDFGIAPLEANASGRPVIAYAGGGALDTVVDGRTGVLFERQEVECLIARFGGPKRRPGTPTSCARTRASSTARCSASSCSSSSGSPSPPMRLARGSPERPSARGRAPRLRWPQRASASLPGTSAAAATRRRSGTRSDWPPRCSPTASRISSRLRRWWRRRC